MSQRSLVSFACFAAAAAWPTLFGVIASSLMSPLERATRDSICGISHHGAELLGHCAACWAGSAILVAAGLIAFLTHRAEPARVRVRG